MFYRIRIDLAFTQEHPITEIATKLLPHLPGAVVINPGQDNEERGYITLEKCYHDESPASPCEVISHQEVA